MLVTSGFLALSGWAAEPSTEQMRKEIIELRQRLTALEQLIEARTKDPTPAPTSAAPAAAKAPPPPAAAGSTSPVNVKLFGYVKLDAIHESRDTHTDGIPLWVNRPTIGTDNGDGEFTLTAKETRFGLKMDGPRFGEGGFGGMIEFDFYGNLGVSSHHAYTPRTRHAYLEWTSSRWSVLAGQSWETYLITFPQTINFSAYNMQGQLGLRRAQLRATRKIALGTDEHFQAKLALAEPLGGVHGADLDGDLQDDGADSDLPVLEWNFEYKRGANRLALAGFAGQERIGNIGPIAGQTYSSWAVILGGDLKLGQRFSMRGSVWKGSNLDSAWGGIGQGINLTKKSTIDAMGGWVQLGWQPTSSFTANLGYSIDDPDDKDLNTDQRSSNQSILLNGYYRLDASTTVGLELLHLRTGYSGAEAVDSRRVQGMAKYQF